MKKTKIIQVIAVITSCTLLTACQTPPMYYDAQDNTSDAKDKIMQDNKAITDQAKAAQNAVVYKDSMYVDTSPIDLAQQPTWLTNTISVHGASLPFSFYSRQVITDPNIISTYQTDLEQNRPVTLNYSGSVEGALHALSAKTGYLYTIHNNEIYWQEYVTKTYDIAFLPGDAEYLVGKSTGGGGGGASGGGGGSGGASGGGGTVTQANPGNSADEYNNIQGKMSVWNDIDSTIKSMLSKNGSVIISQSTTSVTVHDTPERVHAISDYIKQINKSLSQEVMIKVQVLDVNLSKSFNYGIDWALAAKFFNKSHVNFLFNGNFSQPVSMSPLSGAGSSATGAGIGTAASSVLINALSQQGTVSLSTEPTIVTTNNQVASINLLSQIGYLAQVANTTSSSQAGAGQIQTTLTPGQVSTGFTLYILPKVIGDQIYMQISSDLSTLQGIRDLFSSNNTTGTIGQIAQKIQVPDVSSKSFNQRSIVKSGATLILAGFTQLKNDAESSKMFGADALGGKGADQEEEETIVLVTPYILNNNS